MLPSCRFKGCNKFLFAVTWNSVNLRAVVALICKCGRHLLCVEEFGRYVVQ